MRVILDENVPAAVGRWLASHKVTTAQKAGYRGLDNGHLLKAVEGKFDVLVTADRNLRYQRNLAGRQIGIVELPGNRLPVLRKLRNKIVTAVNRCGPSKYVEIPG